jgi:hypothetical protein
MSGVPQNKALKLTGLAWQGGLGPQLNAVFCIPLAHIAD